MQKKAFNFFLHLIYYLTRKSGECFLGHGKSEEKLRVSAAKEAGTSGELFVEKCPKFPLQIPIFGAIVGRRRECAARILKLGA